MAIAVAEKIGSLAAADFFQMRGANGSAKPNFTRFLRKRLMRLAKFCAA
jgi:hypothetical protein